MVAGFAASSGGQRGRVAPRSRRAAAMRAMRALWACLCLVTARAAAAADVGPIIVELRDAVVVDAGVPIRVSDVAWLTPAHGGTAAMADALIAGAFDELDAAGGSGEGGWRRVTVDEVRRALEGVPGVNWGRVSLRGSAAAVRVRREAGAAPATPAAEGTGAEAAGEREWGAGSVGELIRPRIAAFLGVEAADLRLGFDERDAGVLGSAVDGRVVHLRPMSMSGRMPVAVTVYDGDRVVLSRTIRVDASVRRRVLVATDRLERGARLGEAAVREDEQWLSPEVVPASRAAVADGVLRGRMQAGSIVRADDLEAPRVVARGDEVQVHCVTRGALVQTKGRARQDARAGEVIEVELPGGRRAMARINERGWAVLSDPAGTDGPAGPDAAPDAAADAAPDAAAKEGGR